MRALLIGLFVACMHTNALLGQTKVDPLALGEFDQFLNTAQQNASLQSEQVDVGPRETASRETAAIDSLTLADVVASLYRSYPEIARARQQPGVANGDLISAYGAYDTKLQTYSLLEPTGFYENYRHGLGVARQNWWGGYVSAGYRIGRGSFQPWYKERQTDEAGEFKLGITQPLLQGRAIDAQRLAVFQASLASEAAEPLVQQAILDSSRDAARLYWQWVASGAVLEAQRELLALAEKRNQQFQDGVNAGKFAEIDLILNQQLVAERRANTLQAEQKYRASAFQLSLFLRDETGKPMVARDEWLPKQFPVIDSQMNLRFDEELAGALARRPEPQILQLQLRHVQLDRQLARNQTLPRFDLVAEASQDVGFPATKADDKGEFELMIGFQGEVPIQRRQARGKIQSTTAKIAQLNEQLRLVQDQIAAELQASQNALLLSSQVVRQSELSLRAALDTLDRYRFAFTKGKIDLIYLNLVETKANEVEIKLVEAQQDWFATLSQLQIVLGLDPLDQAITISSLPPSDMPGPGNLPPVESP